MNPNHILTQRILIALVLGMVVGLALNLFGAAAPWVSTWLVDGLFLVVGKWFVALLMLLVVPLVFVSLVKAVAHLGDTVRLGKLSLWTLSLYIITTIIAVSTGLVIAWWLDPGKGLTLHVTAATSVVQPPDFVDMLISMVPSNPIAAMAQGNMLQVIVFAVLFGVALSLSRAQPAVASLLSLFDALDIVILRMVGLIMWLAPVGVFTLMTRSLASQGSDLLQPLALYCLAVVIALAVHWLVTYPVLLKLLAQLSPRPLMVKLKALVLFAFSTSSSAASIPLALETTQRLGVNPAVAGFTIPLGATINMDGTAIMQGVAAVFIANAYAIPLAPVDYIMIIMTATLASIGTAAVPGAGLIMLSMVLIQVGLPVEGIALILGVDRLLDMLRTSVNVTGDVVVTTIVADKLGQLDRQAYHA